MWWHGYTFNATLGSRVQNTDTIKNGYFVCYDPEAVADGFAAPTANANAGDYTGTPPNTYPTDATYKAKMRVEGYNADRLYTNVCKPFTGGEELCAGVLVNLPPYGLVGTKAPDQGGYVGGVWVDVMVCGFFKCFTKAASTYGSTQLSVNVASGADGYAGVAISFGTTASLSQRVVARPLLTHDTSTTASFTWCRVGGTSVWEI